MRNPRRQYTGLGKGRTPLASCLVRWEFRSRPGRLLGLVLERRRLAQPRQRILVPGGSCLLPFLSRDASLLALGGLLGLHTLALALSKGLGHAPSVRVRRPDRPATGPPLP